MIILINPRQFKKLMAAIDNLNSNIAALTAAVQNIPQAQPPVTGGATEAQVQSAADAVAAQTAAIDAKLVPLPVAAPAPAPAA